MLVSGMMLFAILQKYEFSSKSQQVRSTIQLVEGCLRYCKSTSFQANHNNFSRIRANTKLFAILQMYEFSSKSQQETALQDHRNSCLRYCKCTSFQANHNTAENTNGRTSVVCDTANVRVFKQITTLKSVLSLSFKLFAILQKYEFSSKPRLKVWW